MSSFQYGSLMNSLASAKRSLTKEMVKDMAKQSRDISSIQLEFLTSTRNR